MHKVQDLSRAYSRLLQGVTVKTIKVYKFPLYWQVVSIFLYIIVLFFNHFVFMDNVVIFYFSLLTKAVPDIYRFSFPGYET